MRVIRQIIYYKKKRNWHIIDENGYLKNVQIMVSLIYKHNYGFAKQKPKKFFKKEK